MCECMHRILVVPVLYGLLYLKRSLQRKSNMWACELFIKNFISSAPMFTGLPATSKGFAVRSLTEMRQEFASIVLASWSCPSWPHEIPRLSLVRY